MRAPINVPQSAVGRWFPNPVVPRAARDPCLRSSLIYDQPYSLFAPGLFINRLMSIMARRIYHYIHIIQIGWLPGGSHQPSRPHCQSGKVTWLRQEQTQQASLGRRFHGWSRRDQVRRSRQEVHICTDGGFAMMGRKFESCSVLRRWSNSGRKPEPPA